MSTALTIAGLFLAGALALLWLRHKGLAETLDTRSNDLSRLLQSVDSLRSRQSQDHAASSGEHAKLQADLEENRSRADALAAALEDSNARVATLATSLEESNARMSTLATALEESKSRSTALAATFDGSRARMATLAASLNDSKTRMATLAATLAESMSRTDQLAATVDLHREANRVATDKLADEINQRLRTNAAALTSRLEASEQRLSQQIGAIDKRTIARDAEREEKLRAIAEQTLVQEATPEDANTSIEALAARVDTLQAKQTADIERERTRLYTYLLNLSTINSSGFLGHRRHLSDAAVRDLIGGYVKALGLGYSKRQLAYIAHKVCLLEDRCVGRLATAIETIVVRLLAARHLVASQGKLHAIEIGTLFGVGAAALYELNRLRCDDIELTLIDPLIGYYGAGEPDVITGEPVSRAALDMNLARCGIPQSRIAVLQGMSEAPAIRAACAGRHFNMLIIDGDHSRAGVKRDFDNYRDLVAPDGLILFDDYDVKEWPDIKAYVDEEIIGRSDLQLVAKGWRTALFRALPKAST